MMAGWDGRAYRRNVGGSLVRDGSSGMKFAARAIPAIGLTMALCLATAAAAGPLQVVSAGDEYGAAHPRRAAQAAGDDFPATMDRVFGPGRWRETSGYRSQAEENALRRQGAGTVAPGHVSRHSMGGVESPSAYDAVVANMSPASAAAKLRRAGGVFSRVVAEGAHGAQGPHLHIELDRSPTRSAAPEAVAEQAVYRRGAGGRRSPLLTQASSAGAAEN